MSQLVWNVAGEKTYETGVDRVVLYKKDSAGAYKDAHAWDGVISVAKNPSGAEATKLYADNTVYANMISVEELGSSIEAYKYPEAFEECDGNASLIAGVTIGQQSRKSFGLAFRTKIGNDTEGEDYGYKIHLIYGCYATPSEQSFETVNDSPDAITFSWEITTTPVSVPGHKPTASLVIDSTKMSAAQLKAIEDVLYGTASKEPELPLPAEVLSIIQGAAA